MNVTIVRNWPDARCTQLCIDGHVWYARHYPSGWDADNINGRPADPDTRAAINAALGHIA